MLINEDQLLKYLTEHGYNVIALEKISHRKDDSECYKLRDRSKDYFVKICTQDEIINLQYLKSHGIKSIPEIYPGTSIDHQIIIEEYLSENNGGIDLLHEVWNGSESEIKFIKFQKEAFALLNELYKTPIDPLKTGLTIDQIFLKMNQPLEDLIEGTNEEIKTFLENPMHTSLETFPSLKEMKDQILEGITVPSLKSSVIHGEFTVPHVLRDDQEKLKLIDFEEMVYSGDPTWDLGRWLCSIHFAFFSFSQKHRDQGEQVEVTPKKIKMEPTAKFETKNIREEAMKEFAQIIKSPINRFEKNALAAEFLNYYRKLQKNLIKNKGKPLGVLVFLLKSYQKWKTIK